MAGRALAVFRYATKIHGHPNAAPQCACALAPLPDPHQPIHLQKRGFANGKARCPDARDGASKGWPGCAHPDQKKRLPPQGFAQLTGHRCVSQNAGRCLRRQGQSFFQTEDYALALLAARAAIVQKKCIKVSPLLPRAPVGQAVRAQQRPLSRKADRKSPAPAARSADFQRRNCLMVFVPMGPSVISES